MRYQWVPSHVGLSGNEQADLAAKTGAQRVGRPDLTLRPSTCDLMRRVNWSLWAKDYREAALHHNWPMTECQGDSTETLFPRHPPQVGHLMTRIRLNCWKSKYTLARCLCLQENISFQHRLFDCPTLQNQFQPLWDLFRERQTSSDYDNSPRMETPHSGSHPRPLLGSRPLPVREATTSQQLRKTRQQPSTQAETTKPEQLALQSAPEF